MKALSCATSKTLSQILSLGAIASRRLSLAALTLGMVGGMAHAVTTDTWSSTGSTDWNTSGNWSAGVPTAASTATFSSNTTPTGVTLSSPGTTLSILFSASTASYTIGTVSGPALTVATGGSIADSTTSTTTQTVNAPLIIGGTSASTYSFSSVSTTSGALLDIGGTVTGAASSGNTVLTLSGTNTGANTVSGVISNGTAGGTLGITKSGAGTWVLSAANTYTGGTTISASGGSLELANTNAAQDSAVTISSANGLTFLSGIGSFTIGGLSGASAEALTDTGSNAVALTIGNGNATGLTYTGALSGAGSITKVGTGTQDFNTATNTYSGGTTINAGVLEFSLIDSMPATGTVTVNSGGTLAVAVGGTGQFTTATSGNGSIGGLLSGTGGQGNTVTFNSGSSIGIDTTTASATYAGNITNLSSNVLGLDKLGTNTLTLTGTNSYTGSTVISAGTLNFDGASTQTLSGNITGTGALLQSGAGTLVLAGADTYSGGTTINATDEIQLSSGTLNSTGALTDNGTFDLNGSNATVGAFQGSGSLTNSGGGTGATGTLTFDAAGTFTGVISDGAGKTAVVMNVGTGTEYFENTNTYSGGTTIYSGTLRSQNTSATLGTGPVTLDGTTNSAFLLFTTGGTVAPSFVISGTNDYIDGNFTNGNGQFNGAFTGSGNLTWEGNSGGTAAGFYLNGSLAGYTGTMDLEFNGNNNTSSKTERLILTTGSSNASGTAFILGANAPGTTTGNDILAYVGTNSTAAAVSLGSLAGNAQGILRNDTAGTASTTTFTIGGLATNAVYNGQITNSGIGNAGVTAINIAELANDSQTLGGIGTYTGPTSVNSGTLIVTGGTAATSATVTTAASGTQSITVNSTAGLAVGDVISGTGIPAGETIAGITSGTTLYLYTDATVTANESISVAATSPLGSGAVTVNNTGTLTVGSAGALAYSTSSGVTVNSGGTLNSSVVGATGATIAPSVTLSAGGSLAWTSGTLGTLTVNNITSGGTSPAAASSMTFQIGGAGGLGNAGVTNDTLVVNGTLSLTGTTDITIANTPGTSTLAAGTYVLIEPIGSQSGTVASDLALTDTTLDGENLALAEPGTGTYAGDIVLDVTAGSLTAGYFNGSTTADLTQAGAYDTTESGSTVASSAPTSTTNIYFSNANNTSTAPYVGSGGVAVNSVTFGSGGVDSGLTVAGPGTLTVENGITILTGGGSDTISAPVALGASQTFTATDASSTLTVSGQISGAYGLTTAGSGAVALSNSAGNTYSGGTTVSAGTLYADNASGTPTYAAPGTNGRTITAAATGSATGAGSVSVSGMLAGSGTIAPASGNGVTIQNGGTLYSGGIQSGSTVTGTGLTLVNASATSPILTTTGGSTLTFALSGTTSTGASAFATPNTNSTYLTVAGNTTGEISFATSGTTTIDLVDLTTTASNPGSLALRTQNPYLLVQAGSDSDYDLVTTGGYDANGYVLGTAATSTSTEDTTAFSLEATSINGGTPNYQNLQLYLYNGDLEVIPEPSTWAMMIGGLAALVFWQRRKALKLS